MLKKLQFQLFLTLGFWLSAMVSGVAQTFPVTISTQITQPSPIYLSNYADATTINSPIKIQIALNDLTISNRQIRLKLYLQGQSISLMTNDFVVGAHDLFLEGGVPLQLTNVDLAPYFEYQNLLGINPNQYAQALPEGIYNFSVEVYDFATNKKLSKKSSVTTIIFQNDPPFLNLPLNNASIMQQNIQNIVFSWTPRQINVSNVEYEFSLVEIWDKYTPVQNAFAYSPPLYTTTTRTTTLQYSVSEPQLLPGKKYAWRVKAKALQGAEEVGVFKNNGYSEIFSFDYETFCTAPLAITTTDISQDQVKITWSGDIDNFDYQVNYREKNADSDWYKLVTPREFATVSNLKPNATYEYTVGASCEIGKYTHSTIHEFTTIAKDEIAFVGCGIKPDPADLVNKNPLPNLYANDVVKAGDFPIVVLKATGSNGTYSGEGYVTLPFLEKFRKLIDAANALGGDQIDIGKFTRVRITFNNIGINTDFKLISGEIIASYDPTWSSMVDGDKILNDVLGSDGKPIEGKLDYVVKSATLNADGSTTIVGENGAVTKIPKSSYDQVFIDKNGTPVTIPANGSGQPVIGKAADGGKATASNTNGMSSSGEVVQISSPDVRITFEDYKDAKYAFDAQPADGSAKLKGTYEIIPTGDGKNYIVNYKAVSDLNGDDFVIARAEFSNGKKPSDIVFKTMSGGKVDAKWNPTDNTAMISLQKTLNFGKDGIIATVRGVAVKSAQDSTKTVEGKYAVAGKLNVWHLTKKEPINVTLLSINGASVPDTSDAEKFLNGVYNKVGITFNVKVENVNINPLPDQIECGNSDILNVYTNGQIDIISQIENSADFKYNDKTYYVLYTGKSGQNAYDGFMPLGGQYAFVFNSGNLKTAAHELGHGIFGLKHPFTNPDESNKTDLLMAYGSGTVLSHNDWDIIHSGGWKFYGFQKSSAGALAGGYGLTPDFRFISAGTSNIVSTQPGLVAEGHLSGFLDSNKVKYLWNKERNEYTVNGESNGAKYTGTILSKLEDDSRVWLVYNYSNNCNEIKYIRTQYKQIAKFISLSDKTKAQEGLDAYIKEIDPITKEKNSSIYSALLGCGESGNGGGNTKGVYVKNLIKGEVKKEVLDKLEALMSGNSKNWITGQQHTIKGHILLTSESEKTNRVVFKDDSFYVDNVKDEIKSDEIVFWLEYSNEGKIRVKQILTGSSFDENISVALKSWESSLDWKQKTLFEKIIAIGYESVDGYFTAYYDMFDMLSSGISKVKIKPSVYNCNDKDYNEIYAKVFSYLSLSGAIQDIIAEKLADAYPEFNEVFQKGTPSQIQFALFCGMYNGLIDVVQSVPDLAKLLISPLSSKGREANSKFLTQIEEMEMFEKDANGKETLIYGKGLSFGKIWYLLKDGIASQFDPNKPCVGAEFVGSIVGPIIVMCIGDVEAGAGIVSKVASATFKALQLCDKLTDPFRYIGMSFRFVKGVSGKVGIVIKNAASDVITQLDNGLFRLKVIVNNTELPTLEMSFEDVNRLVMAGADGIDYPINGVNQRIKLSVSPGSMGSANLSTVSAQVFGAANEQLLKRFIDLGIDPSKLERVIATIGKTVHNAEKLASMLENAPFKDDISKIKAFLNDLEASTDLQDFVKGGKDFSKEWDLLKKAGRDSKLRRSKATIEALSEILNDASMKKILGSEMDDVMEKFITAHKNSKWGWNKFSLQEHMRMLKVIANKYEGVEGFNKSLRDALNNPNPAVQDGFWHMMKDLEKRGIPKEKIKAFDLEFDGDDLPCIKCKFDVELNTNGDSLKYLEYKSYANASRISKPQFLNYISTVDKLEQLQYVFNKSKLSLDEAKEGMKTFFLNNKQEIFNNMKTQLRENILGSGNANRFDLFEQAINNKNSNLYKIINAQ